MPFDSSVQKTDLTILNGQTVSGAVDCGFTRAAMLLMPAAWTAGNLNVQASYDGVTYQTLYNSDGTIYTITVTAAATDILLSMIDFLGIQKFKLVSTVAQGADRIIGVVQVGL